MKDFLPQKEKLFFQVFLKNSGQKFSYYADTTTHQNFLRDALASYAIEIPLDKKYSKSDLYFEHIPLHGILNLKKVLTYSLTKFYNFKKEEAEEIAKIIELEGVESFGINKTKYKKSKKIFLNKKLLQQALDHSTKVVKVNSNYTIPALAGYGLKDHKTIYIDKNFAKFLEENPNKKYVLKYLVMHEIVEKALMLGHKFAHRSYQRTHQVAQRVERFLLRQGGHSWHDYQHKIMKEYIEHADQKNQALNLPKDFDLEPYTGYGDYAVVEAHMKLLGKAPGKLKLYHLGFVEEILPNIYHIKFHNKTQMSKTMLRFQEHYESPHWKGKIFNLAEFKKYYIAKTGKKNFSYYTDWADGFNIPSSVLKPFYEKKFSKLSLGENIILDFFRFKRSEKFYIIITAEQTDEETHNHEIAHAFYYLFPEYKKEIDAVLKSCDLKSLKEIILKNNLDYHESVMDDEAQAWLLWSHNWLESYGLDMSKYSETRVKMLKIYKKYLNK